MSPLRRPPDPVDLLDFPSWELLPSFTLHRVHRSVHGPIYFASGRGGRFNLRYASGTCYLAEEGVAAFLEALQDVLPPLPTTYLPRPEVEARRISRLTVVAPVRLADFTSERAAAFGITGQVHASRRNDHGRTRAWAATLARAGFAEVRYFAKHNPAQNSISVALFGQAGGGVPGAVSNLEVHATQEIGGDLLRELERRFGIRVLAHP